MEVWRNELYHHGILGQKWGVRRYQNYDGTRTPAGKVRYADNYNETQRKRDERIYGRRAVDRINKRMLNNESIQSARHAEVVRKNRINKAKNIATVAAVSAMSIGGVSLVTKILRDKGVKFPSDVPQAVVDVGIAAVQNLLGGNDSPWG